MAIAMGSQGLRPRDVFVSYVRTADDAQPAVGALPPDGSTSPKDSAPPVPIHPADDPKFPWLKRLLGRAKPSKLRRYGIVILGVGRDLVDDGDIWPITDHLNQLKDDPKELPLCAERFELLFEGYDDDPRELWEIPEVVEFARNLDAEFPYWFYFLEKAGTSGLQALAMCVAGYERRPDGTCVDQAAFHRLLVERWGPALNELCHRAGISVERQNEMTQRGVDHVLRGGDSVR